MNEEDDHHLLGILPVIEISKEYIHDLHMNYMKIVNEHLEKEKSLNRLTDLSEDLKLYDDKDKMP